MSRVLSLSSRVIGESRGRAYQALGIGTFILSGYPHLEECRRFGQMVMPLLRQRAAAEPKRATESLTTGVAPVT